MEMEANSSALRIQQLEQMSVGLNATEQKRDAKAAEVQKIHNIELRYQVDDALAKQKAAEQWRIDDLERDLALQGDELKQTSAQAADAALEKEKSKALCTQFSLSSMTRIMSRWLNDTTRLLVATWKCSKVDAIRQKHADSEKASAIKLENLKKESTLETRDLKEHNEQLLEVIEDLQQKLEERKLHQKQLEEKHTQIGADLEKEIDKQSKQVKLLEDEQLQLAEALVAEKLASQDYDQQLIESAEQLIQLEKDHQVALTTAVGEMKETMEQEVAVLLQENNDLTTHKKESKKAMQQLEQDSAVQIQNLDQQIVELNQQCEQTNIELADQKKFFRKRAAPVEQSGMSLNRTFDLSQSGMEAQPETDADQSKRLLAKKLSPSKFVRHPNLQLISDILNGEHIELTGEASPVVQIAELERKLSSLRLETMQAEGRATSGDAEPNRPTDTNLQLISDILSGEFGGVKDEVSFEIVETLESRRLQAKLKLREDMAKRRIEP